jgi:hypothetical protein
VESLEDESLKVLEAGRAQEQRVFPGEQGQDGGVAFEKGRDRRTGYMTSDGS